MDKLEILKAARKLLADPAHWTQRVYARDKNESEVRPWSKEACQFCALGAVFKFIGTDDFEHPATQALYQKAVSITIVNDVKGHDAVLQLFDEVIRDQAT